MVTRSCKRDRETWGLELGGRKTKIIQSWSLELEERWKEHKDMSQGRLNLDNEPWENPGNSRARRQALGSSRQRKWQKRYEKSKCSERFGFGWARNLEWKAKGVSKKGYLLALCLAHKTGSIHNFYPFFVLFFSFVFWVRFFFGGGRDWVSKNIFRACTNDFI